MTVLDEWGDNIRKSLSGHPILSWVFEAYAEQPGSAILVVLALAMVATALAVKH
jgi:hypothetical protein